MKTINDLRKELESHIDKDYQLFSEKLAKTDLKVLGIRMPIIKSIANKYANDLSFSFKSFPYNESLELTLLFFLINLKRIKNAKEQYMFIDKYIQYGISWVITDVLDQYIHNSTFNDYKPFFDKWINSKDEYKRRYAYKGAMKFAREQSAIYFLNNIKPDDSYYVQMAEAWMAAEFAIYHPNEVLLLLENQDVLLTVKRKIVNKLRDSYRINDEYVAKAREILTKIY